MAAVMNKASRMIFEAEMNAGNCPALSCVDLNHNNPLPFLRDGLWEAYEDSLIEQLTDDDGFQADLVKALMETVQWDAIATALIGEAFRQRKTERKVYATPPEYAIA